MAVFRADSYEGFQIWEQSYQDSSPFVPGAGQLLDVAKGDIRRGLFIMKAYVFLLSFCAVLNMESIGGMKRGDKGNTTDHF